MTPYCNGCIWSDQCTSTKLCEEYDPVIPASTEEVDS